jgi:hypothetical protein
VLQCHVTLPYTHNTLSRCNRTAQHITTSHCHVNRALHVTTSHHIMDFSYHTMVSHKYYNWCFNTRT